MTELIAISMFLVLALIALVHFYWALGGMWPGHDEKSLAQAVVGTKGLENMPSRPLTLLVASLILAAGIFPLLKTGMLFLPLPDWMVLSGIVTLAAIFLLRGALTYTWIAKSMQFEEPFNSHNKLLYSPLCLLLGIGFATIILLT